MTTSATTTTGGGPGNQAPQGPPTSVVLVSRSPLFYWWPVWAVGFVMAALSYWGGKPVAFVPPGTTAQRDAVVQGQDGKRDVLIAPQGASLGTDDLKETRLFMSPSNNLGILWTLTLCLVIIVTHTQLRGVRSLLVIAGVIIAVILLALTGMWDTLFAAVQIIDIHLTAFSYLAISTFLFIIWLATLLVFDPLHYMIFTRGQMRVRMALGDGEKVYDTRGMVVEKHRDDLFRHWLLGFGAGDLTVRTGGAGSVQFEMPNILGVGRKLDAIHTMLQEREVVQGSR